MNLFKEVLDGFEIINYSVLGTVHVKVNILGRFRIDYNGITGDLYNRRASITSSIPGAAAAGQPKNLPQFALFLSQKIQHSYFGQKTDWKN